jgi:hypothetical protein
LQQHCLSNQIKLQDGNIIRSLQPLDSSQLKYIESAMNKNRQLILSEGSESVIYDAKMNTKIELKDTSNTKTPVKEQSSPSPGSSRKRKRKFSKRLSFSSEVDD